MPVEIPRRAHRHSASNRAYKTATAVGVNAPLRYPDADDEMDYSPIDCGFHDRLESLAVRRIQVPVEVAEDGSVHVVEARIADVFSRDGAEYARLVEPGGREREVRLDRIHSVAGIPRPGAG